MVKFPLKPDCMKKCGTLQTICVYRRQSVDSGAGVRGTLHYEQLWCTQTAKSKKMLKEWPFFNLDNFFSIHFTYQPFPLPPLLLSPPLSHLPPFPSTSPPSPKNYFLHTTLEHEIYSWILIQCRNTGTSSFKKLFLPTSTKQVVPPSHT